MVKANGLDKVSQFLEGLFVLAWESNNQGCAQGDIINFRADVCQGFADGHRVTGSVHRAQDIRISMLKGQIQIRQDLSFRFHELDQVFCYITWKSVH